jgi:putative membrane protein
VPVALPTPSLTGLATQWSPQPVALAAIVIAAGWYLWSVRRLERAWPATHSWCLASGIALAVWTTNGFPQAYGTSLFWIWCMQMLILLMVVPVLLMLGQPVELAERSRGPRSPVVRVAGSRLGRLCGHALVGPALIPAVSVLLFFGAVPGWAIHYPVAGWVLQVAVVVVGALIVLPLVASAENRSSMAVGLALAVGVFELLLDAVPGIVLRLHTTLATSYFDYRTPQSWALSPIHDQQIGGAFLWTVAEIIDLPFLFVVFLRWIRADAGDAERIDTVLDAERIARGEPVEQNEGVLDQPWWLDDPAMRKRLGHRPR